MKKFIGVGLMAILVVNGMAAWTLIVENSIFNNTVRVDAKFLGCRNDYAQFIKPGDNLKIDAGLCLLKSVHVDHPHGLPMFFNGKSNPIDGLGIMTIDRGTANERYKVVPIKEMRANDRILMRQLRAGVLKASNAVKERLRADKEKLRADFLEAGREAFGDDD